ncbi:MAG TPA: GNAT family N-acetyltransferase [Gaiellaceae bacterium]|nr:GNAT family N-acetyltransferase [Gaiellaceae bacterium]
MSVERVTAATDEVADTLARLLPQLSASAKAPSREDLASMLDSGALLYVFRDEGGTLLGALSMGLYVVPTGRKAIVEDVVVDEAARGQGIGEALVTTAMEAAREAGVKAVWLTSRSEREAANRLYRRLGFEQRETNVYVWRPG